MFCKIILVWHFPLSCFEFLERCESCWKKISVFVFVCSVFILNKTVSPGDHINCNCFPVFWSRSFANLKQILLFLGCFVMYIVWLNDLTCDFVQLCCNWAKFLNFVQNLQMICDHPNKPQRVVNFKMFYCWIVDRYLAYMYAYLLILSSYLFNTS